MSDVQRRLSSVIAFGTLCLATGWSPRAIAGPPDPGGAPSGWHAAPRPRGGLPPGPGEPEGGGPGADVSLGGTREPCLAVSPTNSQNVAMSSLFQYRISVNTGTSWTAAASNVVPAGYGQDGDPSMSFDSQGRLFYSYQGFHNTSGGADEFVSQLNPTTGALVAGPVRVSTSGASGAYNDKDWIAADRFASSPFRDRLYLVWTEFPVAGGTRVLTSFSSNQGATWSVPIQVNGAGEGFVWPAHIAVAPSGDVYISYHSQTGFGGSNPDGISGKVFVARSTNGGVSFAQKTLAFTAGQADITYNVQTSAGNIPGTVFWLQGSGQAWVLPDPSIPGNIYVVANDDPDNAHGSGDDAAVFIVRSTNNGLTWGAPIQVDHGPGTSFQVMPTAAIDDRTGCIVVAWYDNRLGGTNAAGHFLLHVFYTISHNRGLTFDPDLQMTDTAFNPDLGAPARFTGPPATLRIGEYFCAAIGSGNAHVVWTGNTGTGHQIIYDHALNVCCATCAGDTSNDNFVDGGDAQSFVTCFISGSAVAAGCTCADMNNDLAFTAIDVNLFVSKQLGIGDPDTPCP